MDDDDWRLVGNGGLEILTRDPSGLKRTDSREGVPLSFVVVETVDVLSFDRSMSTSISESPLLVEARPIKVNKTV